MATPAFNVRRNVRLLYAFGLAREFTPIVAIWVVYLTDFRHLTLTQVGVMEGLFWAAKLCLEIPSGAFADHFGRRTTFIAGIGLEAVGTAIFAVAGDFTLLAASYVLWSAGLAFRSGNDEAYLYDALAVSGQEHEYSDRIGVYWALNTVAVLAGGLIGGALAQVTTLQIAVLAALVPFALSLPLMLMMQEPPRDLRRKDRGSVVRTMQAGVRTVWRSTELRSILLLDVALSGTFPAFFLLSQPFLDAHGVSLALFGVLAIPIHVGRTAAGLVSGRVARRIGLPVTLVGSLAGTVGGLMILAVFDSVFAFAGLAIAMAAASLAFPVIGAYVNDRTPSDVRATVLSVAPMGTSIMIGAVSLTAGIMADHSLRLAFGGMACMILLVGGVNLLVWLGTARTPMRPEIDLVEA